MTVETISAIDTEPAGEPEPVVVMVAEATIARAEATVIADNPETPPDLCRLVDSFA